MHTWQKRSPSKNKRQAGPDTTVERVAHDDLKGYKRLPLPPALVSPSVQRRALTARPRGGTEGAAETEAPPIVAEVLNTPGRPLDAETRASMEHRLGHDFSRVRVHSDSRAAESARAVGALAYTVGRDIVMGHGQFAPETGRGQRLLAHELAHTLQQPERNGPADGLKVGAAGNHFEREADAAADAALGRGTPHPPALTRGPATIRREPEPVPIDLEVPTPQQREQMRQQGVDLADVSAESADPRKHSDFIDRRLEAVGFGIYLGGYHLYCEGLALPVFLPDALVNLNLIYAEAINPSIYPSYSEAQADIPYGPQQPGQPIPYAYYRTIGGLILPTVVSPATAPRTYQTMRAAMKQLGEELSEELAGVAISLLGGVLLRGLYRRVVGADKAEPAPQGKGGTKGSAPTKSPQQLGQEIGTEVRSLQTGKRATIASKVTDAKLSQADAATATGEASITAFGKIGGTVKLPNGDVVVPSVQVGTNQPVFVVRPNGQVLPARATISVPQPVDLANPVRITDVKIE